MYMNMSPYYVSREKKKGKSYAYCQKHVSYHDHQLREKYNNIIMIELNTMLGEYTHIFVGMISGI